MPNLRKPVSRKESIVVQSVESEVLLYDLKIINAFNAKPRKKIRICLRCQTTLTDKNKCDHCGLKFHDGLLLRWIKKFCGIRPK